MSDSVLVILKRLLAALSVEKVKLARRRRDFHAFLQASLFVLQPLDFQLEGPDGLTDGLICICLLIGVPVALTAQIVLVSAASMTTEVSRLLQIRMRRLVRLLLLLLLLMMMMIVLVLHFKVAAIRGWQVRVCPPAVHLRTDQIRLR